MRALAASCVAVAVLAGGAGRARADQAAPPAAAPDKRHYQTQSMGTVVDVTLWTADATGGAAAAEAVFAEFRRLDALMSNWVDTSDVSRINAAAGSGKGVRVSDETLKVVQVSQAVARRTGGAFDITVGAYRGLWKFDQEMDGTIPNPADVEARRKLTGWRDVVVDARRKTIRLRRKGMAITLGGIAKGYAVDRGVAILRQQGFRDFIVQAGGDLFVSGTKSGQRWRVGIRDPRGSREATFALTELENRTFSTSGDYERGFVKDGVRYHHILDPRTGNPTNTCRSVTVVAKDALTADAWDTTLFILGPEKGLKLLKKMPDLQVVFVDNKNQLRAAGLTLVSGGDLKAHLAGSLVGKVLILKQPTDAP